MLKYYWGLVRGLFGSFRTVVGWLKLAIGIGVPVSLGTWLHGLHVVLPLGIWLGGLVVVGCLLVVLAKNNYREVQRRDRMIAALALIHAPGIEEIVALSGEGKMLTMDAIKTASDLAIWNAKVDDWWKRFETRKTADFTLTERNSVRWMDRADHDGSAPAHNFSPVYVERWRNVKSTWHTLDDVIASRDAERKAVREQMGREGFDATLMPPHFN